MPQNSKSSKKQESKQEENGQAKSEVVPGTPDDGSRHPIFNNLGCVKLHNGCMAYIMTPEQWAKYNYDYNHLNNLPQP